MSTRTAQGLSNEEAEQRIKHYGANRLNNKKQTGNLRLFFAQFKNSTAKRMIAP
ncbi:cation-transporting P-type ATPase [Methylobacter sp.]|uniref:cation-transporting P-type ATPase n=1 Tax=Methylobacter sp. TaxID=2051955 RepID=UPI00351FBA60